MQYKLINKTTGEEHICSKIEIDGMDYYHKYEKYIEDELLYCLANGWLQKARVEHLVEQRGNDNQWKKVIATNNPSIDIPQVVDEVEINKMKNEELINLINSTFPNEQLTLNQESIIYHHYNKSQETHLFSKEDMIEFGQWVSRNDWVYLPSKKYWVNEEQEELEQKLSSQELLQIWKEQKIKTIYYETNSN